MNYVSTIGFFDGVHRGHQYLLRQLLDEGKRRGWATRVYTFAEHPRRVLQADYQPQLLTTLEEKRAFIAAEGIDECRVLEFDNQMARMTAAQFMQQILIPEGVKVLLMGYDHRFGSDRADFQVCRGLGEALGVEILQELPFSENAPQAISSSLVRRELRSGDVAAATCALGRYYTLSGTIGLGRRVGRDLGFPTANLQLDNAQKMLPAAGAYAVWAHVDGKRYAGMTNIGTRPTLQNGEDVTVETHLLDFQDDIYGHVLRLEFVERLRGECQFAALDALRAQLHDDALRAKEILNKQK